MKVLHIINSLVVGGAETLLCNSLVTFMEYYPDVEHHVITVFEKGLLSEKIENKYPYYHINATKYNLFFKIPLLRKYIKKNKIDIIHSHLFESTILSRLSLSKGVKLVSTYHSDFHNSKSLHFSFKRLFADNITYRPGSSIIFVSKTVEKSITTALKITGNNMVLYNFPSDNFFPCYKFNRDNSLKIVAVGVLEEIKNYQLAIQAMFALKEYNIHLDIFGDGKLKPLLQKIINRTGAKVYLKGQAEINSGLLNRYDVFLMTSYQEGMPISLLEAMRTGLPSVLSDIPELKETAQDAGLYFPANSMEGLSELLKKVYFNKVILNEIAKNSLKVSKKFSAEKYVHSLYSIYTDLLNG